MKLEQNSRTGMNQFAQLLSCKIEKPIESTYLNVSR